MELNLEFMPLRLIKFLRKYRLCYFYCLKKQDLSLIFDEDTKDEVLKKYPNKIFLRDDTNSTLLQWF
jgi:hypothetical protein